MGEIDRRIAVLRLRLAEFKSREEQLRSMERQFRSQLEKVIDFAIYERSDLDSALAMAGELEERLRETRTKQRHLEMIKTRGQEELDALLLTKSVEVARQELEELESRRRKLEEDLVTLRGTKEPSSGGEETGNRRAQLEAESSGLEAEMRRLRQVISEASEEAARAVSSRARRRQ